MNAALFLWRLEPSFIHRHSTDNVQLQMQDHGSLIPVHYIHKMDVSETPCKNLLQKEITLCALHHLSQGSYLAEKTLLRSPLSDWMLSRGLVTVAVVPSEHFCCGGVFRWEAAEREWEAAGLGLSWKKNLVWGSDSFLEKNRYEEICKENGGKSWWR